jgi:acyl-CoA reductase-like NAD-dependent aldehyde dehydrogenase
MALPPLMIGDRWLDGGGGDPSALPANGEEIARFAAASEDVDEAVAASTPFGGFKHSGLGREQGRQGMTASMEPKGI